MNRVELKESEEVGFIIDVFSDKNELLNTKTYLYDDLKSDFREYLKDMANDDNCDVTTIEDWHTWIEEEKEELKNGEDIIEGGELDG